MISKIEKKKIIKLLGFRYSPAIREFFESENLRNKNGDVHSERMIRAVVNGEKSHDQIEQGIIKLVSIKLEEVDEREKIMNQI